MKIYAMNDCDWWMAETAEIAKRDYCQFTGDEDSIEGEPVELTEEDLDKLAYVDEPGMPNSPRRSFREQMALRVAAGETSKLFATTEY